MSSVFDVIEENTQIFNANLEEINNVKSEIQTLMKTCTESNIAAIQEKTKLMLDLYKTRFRLTEKLSEILRKRMQDNKDCTELYKAFPFVEFYREPTGISDVLETLLILQLYEFKPGEILPLRNHDVILQSIYFRKSYSQFLSIVTNPDSVRSIIVT